MFCALVNDDTVMVMIKCFAPLNIGHVQTLILQSVLLYGKPFFVLLCL